MVVGLILYLYVPSKKFPLRHWREVYIFPPLESREKKASMSTTFDAWTISFPFIYSELGWIGVYGVNRDRRWNVFLAGKVILN